MAEARIAKILVKRGYELSGLPQLRVDAKMQLQLKIQDKLSRLRLRIRRYGLPLFALDWFSRRLPFPNFRKYIQFQVNQVEVSLLK